MMIEADDKTSKPKTAAKDAPKKVTAVAKTNGVKTATNGTEKAKGPARGKKSGRSGRPKAKTAEELDAEMADYFGPTSGATNGEAAATNGGDAAMQTDEVS
jgi:THO complex subunit 4